MRGERFVYGLFSQGCTFSLHPEEPIEDRRLEGRKSSRITFVFAGLVVLAGSLHPIPSRTRSLKSPALMVLRLKAWESKSPPGLPRRMDPSLSIFYLTRASARFFYARRLNAGARRFV